MPRAALQGSVLYAVLARTGSPGASLPARLYNRVQASSLPAAMQSVPAVSVCQFSLTISMLKYRPRVYVCNQPISHDHVMTSLL